MLTTDDTSVTAALRAALRVALHDHGWPVADDAGRLRGMLNDLLGEHADEARAYVDALAVSVDEGVPGQVRLAGHALLPVVAPDLVAALVEWGLEPERAAWVVDAWAEHLPVTTVLPVPVPERQSPVRRPRRWPLFASAAAVVALALGGGTYLLQPSFLQPTETPKAQPEPSGPPRAAGTELVALATAAPEAITPVGMASFRDGVAVTALADVPEFVDSSGRTHLAPEGGRLVAFTLSDWTCGGEYDDCRSWTDARVTVEVDGETRKLPTTAEAGEDETFVVAAPPGTEDVDLVLTSRGQRQSVSLLDGVAAPGNVAVLARDERELDLGRDFDVTEKVSILINYGDGIGRRQVARHATVSTASLEYWATPKVTASAPDRALLRVNVWFNYPQDENPGERVWYWQSDEVQFRDADGALLKPIRLPGTSGAGSWYSHEYFFDVPASTVGGTLLLGGEIDVVAQNGTPYTATTKVHEFPLRFG